MWNVKTKVIPVIIGVTGTISVIQKIREQTYQENMKSRNYKKQPYWGTAHILRKVLM